MSTKIRPSTETRRYVSIQYAAEYLGLTQGGVRKFIAEGRLSGYRVGKRAIRVDLREVEELLRPIPTAKVREDR
ncbi:helix-turn-helix domain-containing protein [Brachybacterium sp. Z12]|uniref:helix-turn-helix domain-containing protein n=1 Tax=Brachybacterium sp. Z12 TaxID=2759167 RepID=UPI00185F75FE|nr:helix-turn-helix domain-containing protein [Brachybacterium sp. Z12]QNN81616.1 helix-turn-helix domain-containing protein [Brachybacterium sp. Z12]